MLWHTEKDLWGLGWWHSDHGVWGKFRLGKLHPPQNQPAAQPKVKIWPAAPLGGRRPENFCGFGYGFARKKLELAPSTEKKKGPGASPFCEKKLWPGAPEKKGARPF